MLGFCEAEFFFQTYNSLMEKEKGAGFLRKAESSLERNGGKLAIVAGLVMTEAYLIGLGIIAYFIGKEREPKYV